ncbi:acyltransferase [bacterium]|nr:MAG: acyltransferase [bacterium]
MLTSFYDHAELLQMGFASIGKNVRLSRKASFYNPGRISIGDFSRIDDFCVLSTGAGGIEIGRNVHIAVYTSLIGQGKIQIGNFANLSSRVAVYSSNDDYSGEYMTNPTVDSRYTRVHSTPVTIGEHVIIGSGSIILPGVTLDEGVSIGALSLVNKDCEAFKIYAGTPARYLKDRSRNLLKLAEKLCLEEES